MLLKNCRVLYHGEEDIKDILVEKGKIVKIYRCSEVEELDIDEIIDMDGNWVLPGVIDVHTHMRDPGLSYKEDFETGSKACAKGGVTTFIDMPNTVPNTTTKEILDAKESNSKNRSYVDYGFHFGGSKLDNSEEIRKVRDRVASTKIFLNMSTGDMLVEEEKVLENLFKESKIISVHAEEEMVDKAIDLARKFRKPLYLCHLSKKSEVEKLRAAKKEGLKIYGEVAPHHLFLDSSMANSLLIMKPELKSKEDNEALWLGIEDGTIDTIGTDHAPHTLEEKNSKTTYGIPGVENSLEMMLKELNKKIDMKTLQKVMSENPAKIFGIVGKGKIEVGYDADLVVVDLNNKEIIKNEDVISKCAWTPYSGIVGGGKVLLTMVRGHIVYDGKNFIEKIGEGVNYKNV
ncbi:amidohydrolase family protein [Cetobacterium somerae ATCC BAA-474]|uniref:Amidohydrolase family protein n=2 Tax=Cetobacterium TaxID=180162 RepID=U7V801_9FUSO|nr:MULTISPECIES: dihydroorotase family protein [Cetobacterium]ERT66923.1 amidohydrolase family protein [Cetobacterium somerae ATCC BAA-474]MBC2853119.1 dihydroorotase family protein [Cetobacterium sp. 2G large]WVJ01293.1 dihydroorotase family protein [Cetobacterium somerae]